MKVFTVPELIAIIRDSENSDTREKAARLLVVVVTLEAKRARATLVELRNGVAA